MLHWRVEVDGPVPNIKEVYKVTELLGEPGGSPAEKILLHICHEEIGKYGGHPGPHGNSSDLFVCVCIELKLT